MAAVNSEVNVFLKYAFLFNKGLEFLCKKGFCFYWTLSGGWGDKPSKLGRCISNQVHKRYGLKCLFSPDST